MPIPIKNNTQYGGNLINQKYAPLAINDSAMAISTDSQQEYVDFFDDRIKLLKQLALFPKQLNLYAKDWETIQNDEAKSSSLPPIVVVSSKRADWILQTYNRAINRQIDFTDVNDIRALKDGPTPWYMPQRLNDSNRHVYLVVHRNEYDYYRQVLGDTAMTIIGWEFKIDELPLEGRLWVSKGYVGFGASRFAAIEFCKYLFNHRIKASLSNPPVPATRQKAWLVDDNVAYVRGFAGLKDVEKKMTDNIWGLGFNGATKNYTDTEIKGLQAGTKDSLGSLQTTGILQQCVLWNIDQLNKQYLNFSPYFLTSNEDTSFSIFLQNQSSSKLRISSGTTVFKANPYDDDNDGAKKLSGCFTNAVMNFYGIECEKQVIPQPSQGEGAPQNLNDYMTDYVLRYAQEDKHNESHLYTESKAVEQIMAKIVKDKFSWAPATVFRPNGSAVQSTQHYQAG